MYCRSGVFFSILEIFLIIYEESIHIHTKPVKTAEGFYDLSGFSAENR
jgi:hypothetical protein